MLKDFELILHIDKSVKPVVQASRKIPYNLRQKLLEKLIELEENDVAEIVECPTTWVSPFVILPKCSDYICIIVDMRVSNQAIKRERHPIPTVEEIIQEISGDCDFSKLDLFKGYHQLELDAASREITTFSTTFGLRRHKRLTLGATSASENYQQTLERKVFYDLQNVRNVTDDVIIWGKSQQNHDFYLQKALQGVREHGLTLNKEKCLFNLPKATFY